MLDAGPIDRSATPAFTGKGVSSGWVELAGL